MIVADQIEELHNERLKSQLTKAIKETDPEEAKLERLLHNWATWMHTGGMPEFRLVAKSLGENFTNYGDTDYLSAVDIPTARTVNAIMGDLTALERAAINVTYLGGVWSWGRDINYVLNLALGALREGCIRKGIL